VGTDGIFDTTSAILVGIHVADEDAKDLIGVVTRDRGVELKVLFARVSNKNKAREWECR
jgi:hypothetical protein